MKKQASFNLVLVILAIGMVVSTVAFGSDIELKDCQQSLQSDANFEDKTVQRDKADEYVTYQRPARNETAIEMFFAELDTRVIKGDFNLVADSRFMDRIVTLIEVNSEKKLKQNEVGAMNSLFGSLTIADQLKFATLLETSTPEEKVAIAAIFSNSIQRLKKNRSVTMKENGVFLPVLLAAALLDNSFVIAGVSWLWSRAGWFSGTKVEKVKWKEYRPDFQNFYSELNDLIADRQKPASDYVESHLDQFLKAGATTKDITLLLTKYQFSTDVFENLFRRSLSVIESKNDFISLFVQTPSYLKSEITDIKAKYLKHYLSYFIENLHATIDEVRMVLRSSMDSEQGVIEMLKNSLPLIPDSEISNLMFDASAPNEKKYRRLVQETMGDDLLKRSQYMSYKDLKSLVEVTTDETISSELRLILMSRAQNVEELKWSLEVTVKTDEKEGTKQNKPERVLTSKLIASFVEAFTGLPSEGFNNSQALDLLKLFGKDIGVDTSKSQFDTVWLRCLKNTTSRREFDLVAKEISMMAKLRNRSAMAQIRSHLSE